MKVKKFEARSMKEALELVKSELGPDAVILNAKEVKRGFGIAGERSIEVTAAYSESTVQVKKFVETKMPDSKKEVFNRSSAKQQKEIMQKVIENQLRRSNQESLKNQFIENNATPAPRPTSKPRFANLKYVDISDDESMDVQASRSQPSISSSVTQKPDAPILTQQAQQIWGNMEVQSLKDEIRELKNMLQMNNPRMPQTFTSSHPGYQLGVSYEFTEIFQKMCAKGVSEALAAEVIKNVQNEGLQLSSNHERLARVGRVLLESVMCANEFSHANKYHFFMGPSGSGKTSLMMKFASYLTLRMGKSVALVSTDNVKLGAEQEIRLYSQILNLPFIAIRTQAEWDRIKPYFEDVDYVLVDTAGLSLSTESTTQYLKNILETVDSNYSRHLILSAQTDERLLNSQIEQFLKVEPTDISFSGLDLSVKPGTVFTLSQKNQIPLFAFGVGARVPEDFEFATGERIVDLVFEITKSEQPSASRTNSSLTRLNQGEV